MPLLVKMLRAKPLGALSALVLSEQQTKTSPGLTIPITSTFSRAYTVHTPECQAPVRRRRIRRLVSRCPFLKRVRVYLGYPEVPSRASMPPRLHEPREEARSIAVDSVLSLHVPDDPLALNGVD